MNSFILKSKINLSTCDRLIQLYESRKFTSGPPQADGIMVKGVDPKYKKCKESHYALDSLPFYLIELKKCLEKYKKKYPYCTDGCSPWSIFGYLKIQKYKPTEAYRKCHYENNGTPESVYRHLVFMTYLNDVQKGGETVWPSQKLKLKPRKGLTVIWPAYFTHPHYGIAAPKETKYIITGWYNFNKITTI